jgi:hypothetical protein
MNSPLGIFSEDIKIVPVLSYTSGTADRNSEVIDTKGFGRCIIEVHLAAITANAVTNIFLASADAASNETTLTSGSNVEGSSQTIADDDDNQVFYIDFEPTHRYVQLTVNKDATNAVAESAVAHLYHSKVRPVTHAGGTSTIGDGTGAVSGENLGRADQGTA